MGRRLSFFEPERVMTSLEDEAHERGVTVVEVMLEIMGLEAWDGIETEDGTVVVTRKRGDLY